MEIAILVIIISAVGWVIGKIREGHDPDKQAEGGDEGMTLEEMMRRRREELRELQQRGQGDDSGARGEAERRAAEEGRSAYERRVREAQAREAAERGQSNAQTLAQRREAMLRRQREEAARSADVPHRPMATGDPADDFGYESRLPQQNQPAPRPAAQPITPPVRPAITPLAPAARTATPEAPAFKDFEHAEVSHAQTYSGHEQLPSEARKARQRQAQKSRRPKLSAPTSRRLSRKNLRAAMLWKEALDTPIGMRNDSQQPGGLRY